ncbi:hypothetical protein OG896_23035 [Streptomyces sp. NBC_00669]|uniref:hypothetical protein n=1 Tax=Streptomyces sp. NBC_00669 TaxID=2976011 RepID=UPI002E35DEDD|nr:hypothetical protein [Streptomyces sp. NBC_00669]
MADFADFAGTSPPERGHQPGNVRRDFGAWPAVALRGRPAACFGEEPGLRADLGFGPCFGPGFGSGFDLGFGSGFDFGTDLGAAFRAAPGVAAPLDPEDGPARKSGTRSAMERGPLE